MATAQDPVDEEALVPDADEELLEPLSALDEVEPDSDDPEDELPPESDEPFAFSDESLDLSDEDEDDELEDLVPERLSVL
jgi:hypothetical protein